MCTCAFVELCECINRQTSGNRQRAEGEQQGNTTHSKMVSSQLLPSASGTELYVKINENQATRAPAILAVRFMFLFQMLMQYRSAPPAHTERLRLKNIAPVSTKPPCLGTFVLALDHAGRN